MNIGRLIFAVAFIFLLTGLWALLQESGRRFSRKHPELGRHREEGGECGKTCGCANWKFCHKKSNPELSSTSSPKSDTNLSRNPETLS